MKSAASALNPSRAHRFDRFISRRNFASDNFFYFNHASFLSLLSKAPFHCAHTLLLLISMHGYVQIGHVAIHSSVQLSLCYYYNNTRTQLFSYVWGGFNKSARERGSLAFRDCLLPLRNCREQSIFSLIGNYRSFLVERRTKNLSGVARRLVMRASNKRIDNAIGRINLASPSSFAFYTIDRFEAFSSLAF